VKIDRTDLTKADSDGDDVAGNVGVNKGSNPLNPPPVPSASTEIPQARLRVVSVGSQELAEENGAVENMPDGRSDRLRVTEWYRREPKHSHPERVLI
jgi:hypothetical protein